MAGADSAAGGARAGGLLKSVKTLIATLVAMVHTRLELFANEAHAEGQRLAQMLLFGAAALFFVACGVLLLTLFAIVMFWDTHRLTAIGIAAAAYLAIGIVLAVKARARAAAGTQLFAASLAELKKDHASLDD